MASDKTTHREGDPYGYACGHTKATVWEIRGFSPCSKCVPIYTLPTPAVGAAGEAVAWAADGTNIYGNFGRVFLTDEKQVEQYASSNYKITPLYAQPSAGAFTDAQCLEVAKAVDNCIRNHLTESQFLIAAVRAALTARPTSEGREDV